MHLPGTVLTKMKRRLRLSVGFLAVCIAFQSMCCAQSASPERKGSAFLYIVDGFGHRVEPTEIKLTTEAGNDVSPKVPTNLLRDVPYGAYTLRVLVPGFEYWHGVLRIQQQQTRLTVGMQLGSIDGPKPLCSLSGHVTNQGPKREVRAWIRLLPLFGNDIFETDVGPGGEFSIVGVECGKYILTVVSGESVVRVLPAELSGDTKPLPVQIGNASTGHAGKAP
jgi:hypothetical protein